MNCCRKLAEEIWKINNKPKFELYDTLYLHNTNYRQFQTICIIIGEPMVGTSKYSFWGERYFYYYYTILKFSEDCALLSTVREWDLSSEEDDQISTLNDLEYHEFWTKVSGNKKETKREDNSNEQTA